MAHELLVRTINSLENLLKSADINESTRRHAAAVEEMLEKELEFVLRPDSTGE